MNWKWLKSSLKKKCKSSKIDRNNVAKIDQKVKSPEIFKLNTDCMAEICEWLSICDLITLSHTCEVMRIFVGQYFHRNYSIPTVCDNDKFLTNSGTVVNISNLSPFIKKVSIVGDRLRDTRFKYIAENCNSIEHLKFECITLSDDSISSIKNILRKAQRIDLIRVHTRGDFYEKFLKYCEHLSTFCLQSSDNIFIGSSDNKWLQHKFPNLKHLEFVQIPSTRINNLNVFLEKNSQLESLAMNSSLVWKNQDVLRESKIKLKDFAIVINFEESRDYAAYFQLFNELHRQGLFQQLHLYINGFTKTIITQMESLQAFVKLYFTNCKLDKSVTSSIASIIELGTVKSSNLNDIEYLAKNLVNLQRLFIQCADLEDILTFLKFSRNLRIIQVKYLEINRCIGKILNLPELNKARMQLKNARKVTIFIDETLFLTTKFAFGTKFPLIEIKMSESYEWKHHFVK